MKSALIIVDVQNDFLPPTGALAVKEGRDVIPEINSLLRDREWAVTVATRDWHPSNHISFASQSGVAAFTNQEFKHPLGEAETQLHTLWPDHCVQTTTGAEYAPDLDQSKIDAHVQKGYLQDREYYSAFQDVWGVHQTELEELLRSAEITNVVVVGLATDFCVYHTALDSARRKFNTTVIESACRAVYPDKTEETVKNLQAAGVRVLKNADSL